METNDDNDGSADDESRTNYADSIVSDFLGDKEGLYRAIIDNAVRSHDNNNLKQTMYDTVVNKLKVEINSKTWLNNVSISEDLTTSQEKALSDIFPELNIKFTRTNKNAHGYAAASRKCERLILLKFLGHNSSVNGDISVKDVGGNFVTTVQNGERNIHVCSPVLDCYDNSRFTTRINQAYSALSGLVKTKTQRDKLRDFIVDCKKMIPCDDYCFGKSQQCTVKARGLMFLHSTYDIELVDVGKSMDMSRAIIAYGSFIYSSEILTNDKGFIKHVDVEYDIVRDKRGKRVEINFGFKNDTSFNYRHNFHTYISYLTKKIFSSPLGNKFMIELLDNRNGIQFFKITRLFSPTGHVPSHRLPLSHIQDKYVIKFPMLRYNSDMTKCSYLNSSVVRHSLDDPFWIDLPNTRTSWMVVYVEKYIINQTCAFVLGATEEKFKPEQIVTFLRSCFSREITSNAVTEKLLLPDPTTLNGIAHAIYLTLYNQKYINGKLMQQAIIDINSLRSGLVGKDVLTEFRTEKCWFWKLLESIFGGSKDLIDPFKFISEPPKYVEFNYKRSGDIISVLPRDTDEMISLIYDNITTLEDELISVGAVQDFEVSVEPEDVSDCEEALSDIDDCDEVIETKTSEKDCLLLNNVGSVDIEKGVESFSEAVADIYEDAVGEEYIIDPPSEFEDTPIITESSSENDEATVDSNYPRLGEYDSLNSRISVDGSRSECCFIAAVEDRVVDLVELKERIRSEAAPELQTEIHSELLPGAYGGLATLETLAKMFNNDYTILHNGVVTKVKGSNNPTRVINLELLKDHYYIINKCKFGEVFAPSRSPSFFKINLLKIFTSLKTKTCLPVKGYLTKGDDISDKLSGVYMYNNFNKYCSLHLECRYNNLEFLLRKLTGLKNRCLSLLVFFETLSFNAEEVEKLFIKYPDVGLRFVDLKSKEFFTVMLFYKNKNIAMRPFSPMFSTFINSNTTTGKYADIDVSTNTIKFTNIVSENTKKCRYDTPDVTIIITKGYDGVVVSNRNVLKLELEGDERVHDKLLMNKMVADYLSTLYDPYVISLSSDFSNIDKVVQLCSLKCQFLIIDVASTVSMNNIVTYKPETSDLNRVQNSMIEIHNLWQAEKRVTTDRLTSAYNTVIDDFIKGKVVNILDNSTAIFDCKAKKFVFGSRIESYYEWGYCKTGLVNTADLFNESGNYSTDMCKTFLSQGVYHIVFLQSSKLVNGPKLVSKYCIGDIDNFNPPPIKFVRGVPGAGKTEYILNNNVNKSGNFILTVTREAKVDMIKRAGTKPGCLPETRIKTIDSLLMNGFQGVIDELWLDEALLVHVGTWYWACYISGCSRLVVVGDSAQIPYINRDGFSPVFSLPNVNMQEEFLRTNYRNPLDIVYWLDSEKFYPFKVTGTSSITNSVTVTKINGINDIPSGDYVYITFTQSEKERVKFIKKNTYTIHEYQGNQSDNVILVRLEVKEAFTIYKSKPHLLVALTRHRKTFSYCTVTTSDAMSELCKKIRSYSVTTVRRVSNLKGGWLAEQDIIRPDKAVVLYKENRDIRNTLLQYGATGYVPWMFERRVLFQENTIPSRPSVHNFGINALQYFIDNLTKGSTTEFTEFDHENFEYANDFIIEGEVVRSLSAPIFKKYSTLRPRVRSSIQNPLHQSQRVSLKAFFERNGNVPCLQGYIDENYEATRLMEDFKKLLTTRPDFTTNPIYPNIKSFEEWVRGQPPSIIKMINGDGEFIDQKLDVYDFIIKSVPKIDMELGAEFRYKSPQTIAYQRKVVNGLFCPLLKDFIDRVGFSMNRNVLLYSSMSPQNFADLLSDTFPKDRVRCLNKFLEIDFSKYDKSQGLTVLIFECLLMQYFGIQDKYIRMWVTMHRMTILHDRVNRFSAIVEYQRKSGDAGTWRLNTLVQIAVLNTAFTLYDKISRGKCVCCFSGDDSVIFLEDLPHRLDERVFELQTRYNLEAKVMNYSIPYFCSKFLLFVHDRWIFVPDTLKLCIKLGRSDMVDFEHVECYRVSFDDNLYYYKFQEYWEFISMAINDRYKTIGSHDYVFHSLLSVSETREKFAKLYYEGICFIKGFISTRPSIDIG